MIASEAGVTAHAAGHQAVEADAGSLVLAGGNVERDATPGGGGQRGDFLQQLWRAATQGDEGDAVRILPITGAVLYHKPPVAEHRIFSDVREFADA
jgi:hypothetical protein